MLFKQPWISLFSLIGSKCTEGGAVDDDDCGNMLNGVTSTSCILPAPDLHLRRKLKETSLTEDSEWKEYPSKDRKIKSNVSIMF